MEKAAKVAIVTGASQGIGRATALRLAHDFTSIVLVARNGEKLAEVAAEIRGIGADVLPIEADLAWAATPDVVVEKTLHRYGRIDALINNAGAVPQIDLFDMDDNQWKDSLELKFHAARRLTISAWQALRESNGSVVFMSGNTAEMPKASYAAVAVINAAIVALSKAFSERGVTDGVQVNSVLPGPVLTSRREMFLGKFAAANGVDEETAKSRFLSSVGISRFGQASEIAELMAYLVGPNAKWMTGSALRIDGGEVKSS